MQSAFSYGSQRCNVWEEEENFSKRLEEEDFMTEWPQWRHENGYRTVVLAMLVLGYFLGPLLSPVLAVCVIMNQALKAYRTAFDLFVMVVTLYLLAAMFLVVLISIYVYLAHRNQEEVYNTNTDRYGPIAAYTILYVWLAWVMARHFRTLATDGYNPYPEKLLRLRGIPFDPPLIPPKGQEVLRDVPELIRKICLYSDIFVVFKGDGSTVGDVDDAQTAASGNDHDNSLAWMSASTLQDDEESTDNMHNTNWAIPFFLGILVATGQSVVIKVFFSDSVEYTPETKYSTYVYWLAALFWWLVSAVSISVTFALFTLYWRQFRSLMLFSKMTKVMETRQASCVNFIDIKSTRNLLLWHEARTHLVDQIMQPTSFLRAVFDPTCAVMVLNGVAATLMLAFKHVLRDDPFQEFSSLLASNLVVAYVFFNVVINFTRLIQRTLRLHEGLIVQGKLHVLNELLTTEKEVESRRTSVGSTPDETIHDSETICKSLLGPSFTVSSLGDREKWRTATIKLGDLLRKGDKAPAEQLEGALRLLEPFCYKNTVSMSSWQAEGDNTEQMGPCYLVPPCGQNTIRRVRRIQFDPTESSNRRHAEQYRRLRIIESIVTHISHRYVRPKILGMTLTQVLYLGIVFMLAFTTTLMVRVVTSGDYFSD